MTDPRRLTGTEDDVLFDNGDEFTGVDGAWLLPRLRLDPAASPVDIDRGLMVYVDDDELEIPDITTVLGIGPHDGLLVSYGNGGIIGGRYDIVGVWVEDWAAELRHTLTWIGPDPNLRDLAIGYLAEGMGDWEPNEDERLDVDSPYLSADEHEDVDFILGLAADAGWVILNGITIR